MSELVIIIIQSHGERDGGTEAMLPLEALVGDVHDALARLGLPVEAEDFVFVDEAEEPLPRERHHRAHGVGHGSRLHVGRHREVLVVVGFAGRSVERRFPPGARLAGVKEWAAAALGMSPRDAAEHVLQLSGTADKPSPDAAVHEFARRGKAAFDLVPEKRVEG